MPERKAVELGDLAKSLEPLKEDPVKTEPAKVEPVKVQPAKQVPKRGKLPWWARRSEELQKRGTTPRDLFEHDWSTVEAPDEVKKNVRFLWMSDIIWKKRPILTGFNYDIWTPVDETMMKEMGIKTPFARDRTPEGVPRAGMDAFLVCAPEDIARQTDEIFAQGARTDEMMKRHADEATEKMARDGIGVIGGGAKVSKDIGEIHEAEAKERREMGTPFS